MADNSKAIRAGAILFGQKGPALPHAYAEQREKIGRDFKTLEPLRLSPASQVRGQSPIVQRRDVVEDRIAALQIQIGRGRKGPPRFAARSPENSNQFVGVRIRQRL